jgi:hypothetical protein
MCASVGVRHLRTSFMAGGRLNENVASSSGLLAARIFPRWASTIELEPASPIPMPEPRVVKNGSKSCRKIGLLDASPRVLNRDGHIVFLRVKAALGPMRRSTPLLISQPQLYGRITG